MAEDLAIDFLAISSESVAPAEGSLIQAFAAAGLGVAEYAPHTPAASVARNGDGGAVTQAPARRARIGVYTLADPAIRASAKLIVARYDGGVIAGMGDAALTQLAHDLVADDQQTLRTGVVGLDLRLSAPAEAPLPALLWAFRILYVVARMTHGVVLDPAAQRCYGRGALARFADGGPLTTPSDPAEGPEPDPLAHIAFHDEAWTPDSRWLHTHGLQKFGCPELDLVATPLSLVDEGMAFLQDLAENLARGAPLSAGQEVPIEGLGTILAVGAPADGDHQAPFGRLRLTDAPTPDALQTFDAETSRAPLRLLIRMALTEAARCVALNDVAGARTAIERALAADADDCAALSLKARLYLDEDDAMEALQLGELMEVRQPGDYRGPLTIGLALTSIGRYREALNALNRAIEREPEAAEAFAARAQVFEGLGQTQLAAVDRAHAAYLGA